MDVMGWRGRASTVTAATVSVLLVGACSPGSGGGGGTGTGQTPAPPPSVSTSAPAPAPTPTPISTKDYTTRLTKALDPLASALDDLAAAKGYKGLTRRVTAVENGAGKATAAVAALGQLNLPAEFVQPTAQLASALQAFDGALGRVGEKVDYRSLCTGSAVRARLGNEDPTAALRQGVASVYAKLPGDQRVLKLPAADQKSDARPSSGKLIRDVNRNGRAKLEIENNGSEDATVTLTKGNNPDITVYVRHGRSYTVRDVPQGTYRVYFSSGAGWDDTARGFGRDCAFSRFADPMKFRTTRDARGTYWTDFRITLDVVAGGTARTDDVDPDDYPE